MLACWALIESTPSAGRPSPRGTSPRHEVVVSIDGLGANLFLRALTRAHIPRLAQLKAEGSFAEAVEGVYPTLTYPSHTTIVTGRLPAGHGVFTNLSSREPGKDIGDWFWFARAIRAPTLWDEARRAGLTSAAVSWPVTAQASIDWDVPEIWDPAKGETADFNYIARFMDPALAREILPALGPLARGTDGDILRTRLAIYLFTKYKPNLLLLHLTAVDHTEHEYGPESAETLSTLENIDSRLEEILEAIKNAGLGDSTDIFIVSDHGFLPVEREIRPNVLLVRAGLLTADDQGRITGGKVDTVSNGGSFFITWPDSSDLQRTVDRALAPLREEGLLWAVFDRQGLKDLGAEPSVKLALEAPEGTAFSGSARGEVMNKLQIPGGNHGYFPFRSGLEASFVAWGPRVRAGVNLHRIRMTRIGPTLLKDLGIDNPRFGSDPPLLEILK